MYIAFNGISRWVYSAFGDNIIVLYVIQLLVSRFCGLAKMCVWIYRIMPSLLRKYETGGCFVGGEAICRVFYDFWDYEALSLARRLLAFALRMCAGEQMYIKRDSYHWMPMFIVDVIPETDGQSHCERCDLYMQFERSCSRFFFCHIYDSYDTQWLQTIRG